jgi:hypothetical protein
VRRNTAVGFLHCIPRFLFLNGLIGQVIQALHGFTLIGLFLNFCYHARALLQIVVVSQTRSFPGLVLVNQKSRGARFRQLAKPWSHCDITLTNA